MPFPATTALREAIRNRHGKIARILLDGGAPVDGAAFALAGGTDDIELLEKLLVAGIGPDTAGSPLGHHLSSALCKACAKGLEETVAWLLEKGADPNGTAQSCHPLRAAVNQGSAEVVALLLAHGANPNTPSTPDRATPLLHCITVHKRSSKYDPDLELFERLLANGADRSLRSKEHPYRKRNALEYARAMRDQAAARAEGSESAKRIFRKLEKIVARLER